MGGRVGDGESYMIKCNTDKIQKYKYTNTKTQIERHKYQRELEEWEEGLETVRILRSNATRIKYKNTNTQIPKRD